MQNVTQSVRGPLAVLIGSEVREMVSDGGVAISHPAEYLWLDGQPDEAGGAYRDGMCMI